MLRPVHRRTAGALPGGLPPHTIAAPPGCRRRREQKRLSRELQQIGLRHPAAELVRDIQRNRTGIPRRTFVAEGLFENNIVLEAGVAVDTFLWCPEAAYSDEARTRSAQLAARARHAYRISAKTLGHL